LPATGETTPASECTAAHHATTKLPASCRYGPIRYLSQYPDVSLATPAERAGAKRVLAQLVAAAREGNWRDLDAVARAGYSVRPAPRKPGDRSVHFFHAERAAMKGARVVLDPRRPKALIYANALGRPLTIVGAMWSARDGQAGPTPGGPITRWHTHLICLPKGSRRGTKPLAGGKCPPGSELRQGRRGMLHVWFTHDLRSAFAISAPQPELCAAKLLPAGYCKRIRVPAGQPR
jgi:hypothetical protein